jgi:tetratricopeptide (TPR) repeat protein
MDMLAVFALGSMAPPAAAQGVGANHEEGHDGYREQCNSSAPAVAILACTKIIEDQREDDEARAIALQNRGFYYQQAGDLDHSIADYTTVVKYSSGRRARAKVYLNLGLLYFQKGDQATALDNYNEAVRLDPKLTSAYLNRASVFTAAIAINPKDALAFRFRSSAYAAKKDLNRAKLDGATARQLDPIAR